MIVRRCRAWFLRAHRSCAVPALLGAALAACAPSALAQSGPDDIGRWDPPGIDQPGSYAWPDFSMHMVNMPLGTEGMVLVWHNPNPGLVQPHLWDPRTNQVTPINADLPIGCGGQARLADGSLLVCGGQAPDGCLSAVRDVTKFLLAAPGGWDPSPADMEHRRWYPTCTTLPNGGVLAIGGDEPLEEPPPCTCGHSGQPPPPCPLVEFPEVYDPNTGTWSVLPSAPGDIYYPWMFVHTDGRVFGAGPGLSSVFLNVQTGQSVPGPNSNPLNGLRGAAVMYSPGKVLKCGGSPGLGLSAAIDLNVQNPQWNLDSPGPMLRRRFNHNLVILPDGKVLAIGGNEDSSSGPLIMPAELFDPVGSPPWTLMAPMVKPRTYHATATLLADGRVIVAGGDTEYPNGQNPPITAEIYSPPYMFNAQGGPSVRPQIGLAPTSVGYGGGIYITVTGQVPADQIAKVTLVRMGSSTHGFDMDQRFQLLAGPGNPPTLLPGNRLGVTAPLNGNIAPPGSYMLFIISNAGIPSRGWFIQVPTPSAPI